MASAQMLTDNGLLLTICLACCLLALHHDACVNIVILVSGCSLGGVQPQLAHSCSPDATSPALSTDSSAAASPNSGSPVPTTAAASPDGGSPISISAATSPVAGTPAPSMTGDSSSASSTDSPNDTASPVGNKSTAANDGALNSTHTMTNSIPEKEKT